MKLNKISVAISAVIFTLTLGLTSCAGEELSGLPEAPVTEGHLIVAASEPVVTVSPEVFNNENGESYDAPEAQASVSYTATDGNIITAKALHGNVTNISTIYGDKDGDSRVVTVIAYGKAENGDNLREETRYRQQVVAEPEDVFTYQVNTLKDKVTNSNMTGAEEVKNTINYEIVRLKNGTPEKSWKISLNKWYYLYSTGANAPMYTANNPEWQSAVYLPEGAAKNSLGEDIVLAHGTTSETIALKANVFDANGNKIGSDAEAVSANVVTKLYYGDITFVTTKPARISAECTFQLETMNNVVFTDSETGHSEVILGGSNATLSLAGTSYEENSEAEKQLTGSDGKVYDFKGDYTVNVDVNVDDNSVFTSKTKYHTYAWNGK